VFRCVRFFVLSFTSTSSPDRTHLFYYYGERPQLLIKTATGVKVQIKRLPRDDKIFSDGTLQMALRDIKVVMCQWKCTAIWCPKFSVSLCSFHIFFSFWLYVLGSLSQRSSTGFLVIGYPILNLYKPAKQTDTAVNEAAEPLLDGVVNLVDVHVIATLVVALVLWRHHTRLRTLLSPRTQE